MKNLLIPIMSALLLAGGSATGAPVTNGPTRSDFESFRIITERNIFNPNRSGRFDRTTRRDDSEPRVREHTFALLGTMSYEKGRYAFFGGSDSRYHKVLQTADTIASFKIAEVGSTCVKLEGTNGHTLELCVGMQMKQREEEGWQMAGPVASSSSQGSQSVGNSGSPGTPSTPESEDVLKKLMAQRAQEGGVDLPVESSAAPVAKKPDEKATSSADEGDEVLKRLLQKREQELNK
jgi:hypothetical protein